MSTTNSISIVAAIVFTPPDDATLGETRTRDEAIRTIQAEIRERIERLIPKESRCGVIVGLRREDL